MDGRRWTLAAALALCVTAAAHVHADPLTDAIREAGSGDTIVVEFGADWCAPCRWFRDNILAEPRARQAVTTVRFVQVDVETAVGERQSERFAVTALPTFLVLDHTGDEKARQVGLGQLRTVDAFVRYLADARALTQSEGDVVSAAQTGGPESLLRAARWFASRGRPGEAADYYDKAARADKDNQLGIAATAHQEAHDLRAARARRAQVIADAAAQVRTYPGHPASSPALALATIPPDLPSAERSELLLVTGERANSVDVLIHALRTAIVAELWPAAHVLAGDCRKRATTSVEQSTCHDLADNVVDQTIPLESSRIELQVLLTLVNIERPGPEGDGERERLIRAERSLDPDRGIGEGRKRLLEAMRDWRSHYLLASHMCADHRGDLTGAVVRVTKQKSGGRPSRVEVLEPGASSDLERCLEYHLGRASFAAVPEGFPLIDVEVVRLTGLRRSRLSIRQRIDSQWLKRSRREGQSALLYGAGEGGAIDRLSVGARAFVPLIGGDQVRPTAIAHADLGFDTGGELSHEAAALIGFSFAKDDLHIGLFSGASSSDYGVATEWRVGIPFEAAISYSGPQLGFAGWIRATWLPGAETRAQGSEHAPEGTDELTMALALRLQNAALGRSAILGIRFRELLDQTSLGFWLGTDL